MPFEFIACWVLMEIAFLLPPAILIVLRQRKHKHCTEITTGVIVNYISPDASSFYPVVEYDVHNTTYREESHISSTSFVKRHSIGDEITVRYNPCRPDEMYLPVQNRSSNFIVGMFVFFAILIFGIFFALAIANFR